MIRLALLIVSAIFLSACATTLSRTAVLCPPVKAYPADFRAAMANELTRMPDSSATLSAMSDYLQLRDELRECNGVDGPGVIKRSPRAQVSVGAMSAFTWHAPANFDDVQRSPLWINPAVTISHPASPVGVIIGTALGPRLAGTGMIVGLSTSVHHTPFSLFGGVRLPAGGNEPLRGAVGVGFQFWAHDVR